MSSQLHPVFQNILSAFVANPHIAVGNTVSYDFYCENEQCYYEGEGKIVEVKDGLIKVDSKTDGILYLKPGFIVNEFF